VVEQGPEFKPPVWHQRGERREKREEREREREIAQGLAQDSALGLGCPLGLRPEAVRNELLMLHCGDRDHEWSQSHPLVLTASRAQLCPLLLGDLRWVVNLPSEPGFSPSKMSTGYTKNGFGG
jgi:hypothetical protein